MCLAVPLRVIDVKGPIATVDVYGGWKEISLLLMGEEVRVDEYVLVHAGFAIQKLDEQAAMDALNFIQEIAAAEEQKDEPS
jgi:hydrogenase expression/formation protein HypC